NGVLRRIAAGPGAVSTIAGAGQRLFGDRDGAGDTARFRAQMGMVITSAGELLLADTANYRVRKVIPGADAHSTQVLTVAGSGRQGTRLGAADQSDLVAPTGLALLPNNAVLVSDSFNNVIRLIQR